MVSASASYVLWTGHPHPGCPQLSNCGLLPRLKPHKSPGFFLYTMISLFIFITCLHPYSRLLSIFG